MCGIAGFLSSQPIDPASAEIGLKMASAIAHRGPDDAGVWTDAEAGVVLAHRRLSILDLSAAGHQPMISASGRYVISYNGEIYNFQQLRQQIGDAGGTSDWRSDCDTEVLLAAVDLWGVPEALRRFEGMFAFALWDRNRRVLTLARDRFGEKPLYYGFSGGVFLFGSELKALRAHPRFEATVDPTSAARMLGRDYVPAPRSIFEGISKLRPAHFLEIADGGRSLSEPDAYWSLEECARASMQPSPALRDYDSELDTLLTDAVRRQMLADVPLGAFLSGGIDSSLIVALMQAQSTKPVQTFTIGFDDPNIDEADHARTVAAQLGCSHAELLLSGKDALDVVPAMPAIWDEPLGDPSAIPTYLLSALTHKSVKVALSGDGADELFGGYSRYRSTSRDWQRIAKLPAPLRKSIRNLGGRTAQIRSSGGRIGRMLGSTSQRDLYEWKRSRLNWPGSLVLGAEQWDASIEGVGSLDGPQSMMLWDSLDFLPNDILAKVDRASMAVSLETRAPFLDHRVAEFAWKLPIDHKVGRREGKVILRRLLRRYLPAAVTSRRKMGFAVPLSSWLKGPLRPWAEDLLSEARLSRQGILDPAGTRALWHDFLAGKPRHERPLWNILTFQAWLEGNS